MHLDLTDEQALAVASTLRYTVVRIQRLAENVSKPIDKRVWALNTVAALRDVIDKLPEPPVREQKVERPTHGDQLRALLGERPMTVEEITQAIACSDREARKVLKSIGAEVASIDARNRKTWTLR